MIAPERVSGSASQRVSGAGRDLCAAVEGLSLLAGGEDSVRLVELAGDGFFRGQRVGIDVQQIGAFFASGGKGGAGAKRFEDAGSVLTSAHGHAAGAGDFEDGVGGFAEDLDE